MKRHIRILTAVFLCLPFVASAHAIPVETFPSASSLNTGPVSIVSIRFSERIDLSASSIEIEETVGRGVRSEQVSLSADKKTLSIPVQGVSSGAYKVSWSVVSTDDGHFTRGGYFFEVGTSSSGISLPADALSMGQAEVIQISTKPEAFAMTVELLGNGMLWAILVLYTIGLRRILKRSGNSGSEIRNFITYFFWTAAAFALIGGALQFLTKSSDLAQLRSAHMLEAVRIYAGTTAGIATLARMACISTIMMIFAIGRRKIFQSSTLTIWEYGIGAMLLVFAYFRAIISHATANPFHPEFSIVVNFLHLIEKDIWAGIALFLFVLALRPTLRLDLLRLLPFATKALIVDFAAVSVTATYIVWLHLKSLENLFTTQWGSVFMNLLVISSILVILRSYHVLSAIFARDTFGRYFTLTIGAEAAVAVVVVYCSSVVIITSPPIARAHVTTFSTIDNGVEISLSKDTFDDSKVRLMVGNGHVPFVSISDQSNSDPLAIHVERRSEKEFELPLSAVQGSGVSALQISVKNDGALDSNAIFNIERADFVPRAVPEEQRNLDAFTLAMIAIALLASTYALIILRVSEGGHVTHIRAPVIADVLGFFIVIFLAGNAVSYADSTNLWNPFRAQCEADGNMWHVMLPMKAGIPTSQVTAEGCMWGMGRYAYLIADRDEYEWTSNLGSAKVSFIHYPESLVAGHPSSLKFNLKEQDGSPARLFVDMEKLLHVVIVSKDQTVFAHVHPDDLHPLTDKNIQNSEFEIPFVFPKAGTYLISADFAHGTTLESEQFTVEVGGAPKQTPTPAIFASEGDFGGYHVSLKYQTPFADSQSTLQYEIRKDGKPVTDLEPYLSAAMHISVVKNDLSKFIHIHGEVHAPGAPLSPIRIKDGAVAHSMQTMTTPAAFGPVVEAHLIFPVAGMYTVWGEFRRQGKLIPAAFSVHVE